jgi:hypothetical protein
MLGFAEEYSELKRADFAQNIHTRTPERMTMFNDGIDRLGTNDEEVYKSRKRPPKVVKALQQQGLLPNTVYAGWDQRLSDDSDEAIEQRKKLHNQQHVPGKRRSPWASRKSATQAPTRSNITVTKSSTPWSR